MSSSEENSETDVSTRADLSSIDGTNDTHSATTSAVSDATSAFTGVIVDHSPITSPTITYQRNVRRQLLADTTRRVDLSHAASNYEVQDGVRRMRVSEEVDHDAAAQVMDQQIPPPSVASGSGSGSEKEKGKLEESNVQPGENPPLEFNDTDDKRAFTICKRLLSVVVTRRYGDDYGTYGCLDIIRKPVCMSTVENRLENNCYRSPREFYLDAQTIMMNAARFNLQTSSSLHMKTTQIILDFNKAYAEEEAKYNSNLGKPAKPRAKAVNKRDMTYEEKQKLCKHLESLTEQEDKEQVVEIIKKRNNTFSQGNDAQNRLLTIETDVDRLDVETLWELDRFYSHYKRTKKGSKSISRRRRSNGLQPKNPPEPMSWTNTVMFRRAMLTCLKKDYGSDSSETSYSDSSSSDEVSTNN